MKTSELIGPALDWAVAKCEGFPVVVVTVEDQVEAHERVMREHYSDAEWAEHLANWNKAILPGLKPRLAALDSEGFPNGFPFMRYGRGVGFDFCNDWSQGGPIIEREEVKLGCWRGDPPKNRWQAEIHNDDGDWILLGPTPLVAAMRCYVASKLGEEVDVPEELL